MLAILKKRSDSASTFRLVAALIVFAGMLIWTKMGIFSLLVGPRELDLSNPKGMAGKYVYYDANAVLGGFTSIYKDKSLQSVAYSIYDYDTELAFGFERQGGKGHTKHKEMDAKSEEFWDYNDGVRRAKPEPIRITGTWVALESTSLKHFKDWMKDMNVETVPYMIKEGTVAGMNKPMLLGLTAVGLAAFGYAFWVVLSRIQGKYDKHLKTFIENNPDVTMAMIEQDFNSAKQVGKSIWVGKLYTIYMVGTEAQIINNKKLVWAYYYLQTGRTTISQVRTYNADRVYQAINVSENESKIILQEYAENQPQMVVGYDKKLEKLYNKEFEAFLSLRYNAPENNHEE